LCAGLAQQRAKGEVEDEEEDADFQEEADDDVADAASEEEDEEEEEASLHFSQSLPNPRLLGPSSLLTKTLHVVGHAENFGCFVARFLLCLSYVAGAFVALFTPLSSLSV